MIMKSLKAMLIAAVIATCLSVSFAQGGKAGPLRIEFTKGKSSAAMKGSLKGDEQMEYSFSAKAGQKISIKVESTSPKGRYHHFSVMGDGFELPGLIAVKGAKVYKYADFFEAPKDGDYLIFVNFKPSKTVKSGKFKLTLSISN